MRVLVSLVCVLALAISASAERAWVLWSAVSSPGGEIQWTADGLSTASECYRARDSTMKVQQGRREPGETLEVVGSNMLIRKARDGDVIIAQWTCLPGTVDSGQIVKDLGGWKSEAMMRRYASLTSETLRVAAEAVAAHGAPARLVAVTSGKRPGKRAPK